MEPVEQELGLTRSQSSLAFSLALFAEGALAYPVGRWIDRGHERAVMTGGSLLVAACLALHSAITASRRSTRCGSGWARPWQPPCTTRFSPSVTRRFPLDFRRAIITLTFLGGLASTVFIPLSAWLIHSLGGGMPCGRSPRCNLLVCVPLHAFQLRGAPPAPAAVAATSRVARPRCTCAAHPSF